MQLSIECIQDNLRVIFITLKELDPWCWPREGDTIQSNLIFSVLLLNNYNNQDYGTKLEMKNANEEEENRNNYDTIRRCPLCISHLPNSLLFLEDELTITLGLCHANRGR